MATPLPSVFWYNPWTKSISIPTLTKAPEPPEFKEGVLYDRSGSVYRGETDRLGVQWLMCIDKLGSGLGFEVHKKDCTPHRYQVGQQLALLPEHRDSNVFYNSLWRAWSSREVPIVTLYDYQYDGDLVWIARPDPYFNLDIKCHESEVPTHIDLNHWFYKPMVTQAPTRPRNTTCNCGSPAFQMFSTVECESPKCRWYKV